MRWVAFTVSAIVAIVSSIIYATAQVDLTTFRAGDVILAEEVNQNFQALADAVAASLLPAECTAGQVAEWSGAAWVCGQDDVGEGGGGGDITAVTAGTGLLGGGASGEVELGVDFAGSGETATVARSDHDHLGQSWTGDQALIVESSAPFNTSTGGVLVLRNRGGGAGLLVGESSGYGLWVRASDDTGLVIDSAGRDGIFASAAGAGAELHGRRAGLVAGGSPSSATEIVPDIILASNSCFPCGPEDDDGRIYSQPNSASSDIFLVSNDAVVVQLDANGGEESHFQVQDGSGRVAFQVAESGEVRVNGVVAHSSDRALKRDLETVDPRAILEQLARLEVSRWRFVGDDSAALHLGPMAQDFHSAFGLGGDERYISATDADGVALAAIQGLYEIVLEQRSQIAELSAELALLKRTSPR